MEVRGQHDDLADFAWERTRYPLNRRRDGHIGEEKISWSLSRRIFVSKHMFKHDVIEVNISVSNSGEPLVSLCNWMEVLSPYLLE